MIVYDLAIIGAGAAGLAAASSMARYYPEKKCAVIEKDSFPGGIMLQCIHSGFGLHYFGKEMTGPEYGKEAFERLSFFNHKSVDIFFDTVVVKIDSAKSIICNRSGEEFSLKFQRLLLATGSREIPFGSLCIPSERPAGIFGAGEAQLLMNRYGKRPGNRGVILGAGDIGLIMARRLFFEGIEVAAVIEIRPEPAGVRRNVQTCIFDLGIPLQTSSTISRVHGRERVEGVEIVSVGPTGVPDFSSTEFISCDFLLSATGLAPEIGLAEDAGAKSNYGHILTTGNGQTSIPWMHVCGNAAKIFPLADDVSLNSEEIIKEIFRKENHA